MKFVPTISAKTVKKGVALAAGAMLLATVPVVASGSAAEAMKYSPRRTDGCGSKIVQINWKSTGQIYLWSYNSNSTAGPEEETLVASPKTNGAHSYNSGKHTFTWAFGAAPGNVSTYSVTCVSFS